MPITYLYYIFIVVVMALLIANIVVPLFNPKYKFFWLLRKDKYFDAIDKYNLANKERDTAELEQQAKKIKKNEEL